MVYWLGKSSLFLPESVRKLVSESYSPNDIGDDVSYLTEANVRFAFLYLDNAVDEALFIRSVRICKNLDRALIVVHHSGSQTPTPMRTWYLRIFHWTLRMLSSLRKFGCEA